MKEETLNANYLKFIKYLQKYNCYSEEMINDLGEQIKVATYNMEELYGGCYEGALIDVTLNVLCKIGFQLNENTFGKNGGEKFNWPLLAVNPEMLMRVLLLTNLSKAVMFTPQTNDYFRKKGKLYEFAELNTVMKRGQRTLYLCQKYGIKLSEEEVDAINFSDRTDDNANRFSTPLAMMVYAAEMFTIIQLRNEERRKQNA